MRTDMGLFYHSTVAGRATRRYTLAMESCRKKRVVVVGGGHGGAEAAAVAARLGLDTVLLTLDPQSVGRMSCNPSIGGLAKGQIVRELDALGGIMGRVADRTAIHFRLLNRSRGPAVQSPRSQNDRGLYEQAVRAELTRAGVETRRGEVVELLLDEGGVCGVRLAGGKAVAALAVVLTTGTFLGGMLHRGEVSWPGGRLGEGSAQGLGAWLQACGLRLGRLKTGTPPRLLARSIRFEATISQPSDEPPTCFSFEPQALLEKRVACSLTRTTPQTHAIVEENLDRSPLFSGRIQGRGPRYCPSLEDKIFRFPERTGHQVFLEPEGLGGELIYPNGISTSLPEDVQLALVHSIPALEEAEIAAFGYAVEYSFVDPTQCDPTLECRAIPGLYLAGQINGTTGYEEAAGQGFLAGANAALKLLGRPPLILGRHEAYLGVLVDDLVTRGVSEPYRMFTSLAEHRLLLRHQDADVRLVEQAQALGVLDQERLLATEARRTRRKRARALLQARGGPSGSLWEALRSPSFCFSQALERCPELAALKLDRRDLEELLLEAGYGGYIQREQRAIAERRAVEERLLPQELDYASVPQLRQEAREKFQHVRPRTLGQAGRIPGISPADLGILMVHLKGKEGSWKR